MAERICGPPGSVSRSGPTPFNQHAAINLAKLNAYQGRLRGLLVRLSQARIASATSAPFQTLRG